MIMDNPELAEELRLKIVAAMNGSEYHPTDAEIAES